MAYYPSGYEEVIVAGAVKNLDATKAAECQAAVLQASGGAARYRLDTGAPTAAYGLLLTGNSDVLTLTQAEATGLRVIAEQASAPCTLRVTYYQKA